MRSSFSRCPATPLVLACLFLGSLGPVARAQSKPAPWPRTAAEVSGGTRTSSHQEVLDFIEGLQGMGSAVPMAVETVGRTNAGRPLVLVRVGSHAEPGSRPRVLVMANIHGGEVEGKEASLMLLREFLQGNHAELLGALDVWVLPNFNPDGNDAFDSKERVNQNGPAEPVGRRSNGQHLDLNRDFIKVESPEVRALLGVFRRIDPHLFMDLHTTNGSPHGYHLTYATSLSPNAAPPLHDWVHDSFLPSVQTAMTERHALRTFDYGNFPRSFTGKNEARYVTFGHEARYATNYYGFRNRVSVLSEAYAYYPFERRIAFTRAFVIECLAATKANAERLMALCARADREPFDGAPMRFGYATKLVDDVEGTVLLGRNEKVVIPGRGTRNVATGEAEEISAKVQVRFHATEHDEFPAGWALRDASDEVRRNLLAQGIVVQELQSGTEIEVDQFVVSRASRSPRPFQGHRLVRVRGAFERTTVVLDQGCLIVPARQRLARLAAQLLDPRSEDGLLTWNAFDDGIAPSEPLPVCRLPELPADLSKPLPVEEFPTPRIFPAPSAEELAAGLRLQIRVTKEGKAIPTTSFESLPRWEGREVAIGLSNDAAGVPLEQAAPYLSGARASLGPDEAKSLVLIIEPAAKVLDAELLEVLDVARRYRWAGIRLVTRDDG